MAVPARHQRRPPHLSTRRRTSRLRNRPGSPATRLGARRETVARVAESGGKPTIDTLGGAVDVRISGVSASPCLSTYESCNCRAGAAIPSCGSPSHPRTWNGPNGSAVAARSASRASTGRSPGASTAVCGVARSSSAVPWSGVSGGADVPARRNATMPGGGLPATLEPGNSASPVSSVGRPSHAVTSLAEIASARCPPDRGRDVLLSRASCDRRTRNDTRDARGCARTRSPYRVTRPRRVPGRRVPRAATAAPRPRAPSGPAPWRTP